MSQDNDRNPYSLPACIAVLLIFGAATQLGVLTTWL